MLIHKTPLFKAYFWLHKHVPNTLMMMSEQKFGLFFSYKQ